MQAIILIVSALAGASLAMPRTFGGNNIANQRTVAIGGAGSTVIANGQATAGNTFGRGKDFAAKEPFL